MTSLAQIVAALSVTYNDQGAAMWLAARNRALGSAAPIDVIARDPAGLERVADLVRAIGDADPRLFTMRERSPLPPVERGMDEEQIIRDAREVAEMWLYDGDRDRSLSGYEQVMALADLARDQGAALKAAWEWIARTEPHPELNGDLLRGLRAALSGSGDPGPKLNPPSIQTPEETK